MTAKKLDRRTVEFYATSARIAHAYLNAASRNKTLDRFATIRRLAQAVARYKVAKRVGESKIVVLSHADDDHFVLTDERVERAISGAFHLLFTGPADASRQNRSVDEGDQHPVREPPSCG